MIENPYQPIPCFICGTEKLPGEMFIELDDRGTTPRYQSTCSYGCHEEYRKRMWRTADDQGRPVKLDQ